MSQRTEISTIGEFGLIDRLTGGLPVHNASTQLGVVELDGMLDDGQAEAGAAGLSGMALVHAVEPLEDALLLILRNSDSVILYDQYRLHVLMGYSDMHLSALIVVTDGISGQIIYKLREHATIRADFTWFPFIIKLYTALLCIDIEIAYTFLCNKV